jgi:hypothetical protein
MPIPYGRALIPIGREKKMSLLKEIVARILFPNREVDFIPVLDGAFSPNQRLDEARVLGPEITSPDDMVFGKDGALYISSERKIYRCTGLHFENRDLLVELPAMVGGLAQLPSGHLLACVSGYGLFQVSTSGDIVRKMESVQGQALRCLTSVTIADDGTVYVTDGSSRNQPEDWLPDLMQNLSPTGRLIACKSDFSDATVCIERLNWPAGVVLSQDEAEVWITESWGHKLTAYSRNTKKVRTIRKNFAGYPGRIIRLPDGDFWMAFFAVRTQLTEFVIREREFCEQMMKTVPRELWIGPSLDGKFNYREPTQIGRIKKLGIQKPWAPPRSYGLIARLDSSGEVMHSLHSRVGGRIHGVTSLCATGDRILALSKGRDLLVELPDTSFGRS